MSISLKLILFFMPKNPLKGRPGILESSRGVSKDRRVHLTCPSRISVDGAPSFFLPKLNQFRKPITTNNDKFTSWTR